MPAFSTHYIFAKEMMPILKEIADFNVNEEAVYFGAQGPDVFFFHRVLPWTIGKSLLRYGSLIHKANPSDLLECMREYCKSSASPDIAKSYVYGFILHYSLDRICHPYVYALQDSMAKSNRFANPHSLHNQIEFALDAYMLNKRIGVMEPDKFDTGKTVGTSQDVIKEIASLLKYLLQNVIDKSITQAQGETALRDMRNVQRVTFDPTGIKKIIVTPVEILLSPFSKNYKFTSFILPKDLEKAKKYANINNDIWVSPYENGNRSESFEELFEASKKDAEIMISLFQHGAPCEEITENKSFLTGVEIK